MGTTPSLPRSPAHLRLSSAIPPVKQMAYTASGYYSDTGVQAFANNPERDQFIEALLVLLSANTRRNLSDHDFKLLYTRRPKAQRPTITDPPAPPVSSASWFFLDNPFPPRDKLPDDGTRLVATLVALNPAGVIVAKIEPEADGADVGEAFRAFKRDVEQKLGEVLRGVPSVVSEAQSDTAQTSAAGREEAQPSPPAYGDVKR